MTTEASDEVGLADIFNNIWRFRYKAALILVCGSAAGVLIGLMSTKQYEATAVITAVSDDGSSSKLGGLSALASQYSGLASLAGVSMSAGNHRDEYLAVLQSELLTEKYVKDNDLLPVLFPKKQSSYFGELFSWKSNSEPTLWKANQLFKKRIRNVSEDKKTGMVSLRITWKDPAIAARWANDLIDVANLFLKDKALQESERNVAYLNEQATKTDNIDAKRVIYALLQEELNKIMMARGREQYALKVIDPAVPPEKPSSLGPLSLGVFGLVITMMGIIFFALASRLTMSNKTSVDNN